MSATAGQFLAACLVGAVALTGTVLAGRLRERKRLRRRLRAFADILEVSETVAASPATAGDDGDRRALATRLDAWYPLAGGVRTALIAAVAAVAVAATLLPALLFFTVGLTLAAAAAVGLAGAAAWLTGHILEQRQKDLFQERFLVAIEDFERMVRFGIPATQALGSSGSGADEPVRSSLRKVLHAVDLGVPLGGALAEEARRVRVSEMAMLAAIVSTQSRTGGGLAESVSNLTQMLRERIDSRTRLRAATSEPKISLIILAAVPFAGVGLQAATQPQLIDTLLTSGRHLLGIGAGLIVAGMLVAVLIVRSVR